MNTVTGTNVHRITAVTAVKGISRHGRMKTNYVAVCLCGWADPKPPIGKPAAKAHGARHVHAATHIEGAGR